MKISLVAAALLILACLSSAQSTMRIESQRSDRPGPAAADSPAKPTPEQLQRGRQMLEVAEAQASGLQAGMHAYALLEVSRAYQDTNKGKAKRSLQDALTATRGMDEDALHTKRRLQERVLQALVRISPQSADQILDQAVPEVRGAVLRDLLQYYKEHKDLDRAIQILYRAGAESEIPYDAAGEIMAALPPERSADLLSIFNTSLNSYSNNDHNGAIVGEGDFADLISRYWRKLPKDAVLEAIGEVLKQAKAQSERSNGLNISMGSSKGAVAFNSYYDYRLFQLLPILKELDESGAKKLVEEHQQVQTLLAKYPQGMGSLNASDDPNASQIGFMTMTDNRDRPNGGRTSRVPSALEMQQMSKIVADADSHPQDALANAELIARPLMRAHAYEAIARSTAKKNPGIARQALDKMLDLVPQLDSDEQLRTYIAAAESYLALADMVGARKAIEHGLKAADKEYEQDTDADDPNKALKAYWPSTNAYTKLLRLAARISPAWATQLADQISDPDIKTVVQIALAQSWLGIRAGGTTIMSNTKAGPRIMMDLN